MATVKQLSELQHGQAGDFFAQLWTKQKAVTRQGRPYFALQFRDHRRTVASSIWEGSPLEEECRDTWKAGHFYKIRGSFQESRFGPQIEIQRLRPVEDEDTESGFDPLLCQPTSESDSAELFDRLLDLMERELETPDLRALVMTIFEQHRERLEAMPGAVHHHHAYAGGFLEHIDSVTRNVLFLLDTYRGEHPSLRDPLTRQLAIAGALLHDIGKLRELDAEAGNTAYTTSGELIGHILQGRDLVRETAQTLAVDAPWLVRLEHLLISHQGKPESGSPKRPMTWEANLVFWADELDGNIFRLAQALEQATPDEPFVRGKTPFGHTVYRGELTHESEPSS